MEIHPNRHLLTRWRLPSNARLLLIDNDGVFKGSTSVSFLRLVSEKCFERIIEPDSRYIFHSRDYSNSLTEDLMGTEVSLDSCKSVFHSLVRLIQFSESLISGETSPKPPKKKHIAVCYLSEARDSRWRTMGTPMAPLILAGSLEKAGHTVEVVRLTQGQTSIRFKNSPDVITMGVYEDFLDAALPVMRQIKQQYNSWLVAGGPMVTLNPGPSLLHLAEVDAFVCGEADLAIADLVNLLPDKSEIMTDRNLASLLELEGCAVRLDDTVVFANFFDPVRVSEIQVQPPAFEHLTRSDLLNGVEFSTSRGCKRACVFCAHIHGKKVRLTKTEAVRKDLESASRVLNSIAQKENRPIKLYLNLNDDDLFQFPERAFELLGILKETGFKIWGIQTSLEGLSDQVLRNEIFDLFTTEALFVENRVLLWIGTDTFIDERLKRLGKSGNQELITQIVDDIDRFGIKGYHYWILTDADSRWPELVRELIYLSMLKEGYHGSFHVLPNAGSLVPYTGAPVYRRRLKNQQTDQIVLNRLLKFPGLPEFDYPIVAHERPSSSYLYASVEPRANVPESLLVNARELLDCIREGQFADALGLVLRIISCELRDIPDHPEIVELAAARDCIIEQWSNQRE